MADPRPAGPEANLVDDRTDVEVCAAALLRREVEATIEPVGEYQLPVGEDEIHHRLALVGPCLLTKIAEPPHQVSQLLVQLVWEAVWRTGQLDSEFLEHRQDQVEQRLGISAPLKHRQESGIHPLMDDVFDLLKAEERTVVAEDPALILEGMGVLDAELSHGRLPNVGNDRIARQKLRHPFESVVRVGRFNAPNAMRLRLPGQIVGNAPAMGMFSTLGLQRILCFHQTPLNLEAHPARK